MQIAATAEFVDARFSLKMAHTLTYCLPLDNLLLLYDLEFSRQSVELDIPYKSALKHSPILSLRTIGPMKTM
jgi:hypothetical protein